MESETQILISQDLGYPEVIQGESLLASAAEVGRILNGLLNSLPNKK